MDLPRVQFCNERSCCCGVPSHAQNAPRRELRGPVSKSFLGPRSSGFERLKQFQLMGACRNDTVVRLQSCGRAS
eukprot:2785129-Alexandrium_andersonii.AAC.1